MPNDNNEPPGEGLIEELAAARRRLAELNVLELGHRSGYDVLQAIVEGTGHTVGVDFFRSLVRQLATALNVRYAFVAECIDPGNTKVRTLAFWTGTRLGDAFEYSIANTPCEAVLAGELCYFPRDIQTLFPMDADLATLKAQSYIGIPLFDSAGETLGHLAVLDDRELPDAQAERAKSIVKLFSARAAVELERKKKEELLHSTIGQLREALATVKTLRGLLPLCAWCRKVRVDDGYWSELETFITRHTELRFSHGACPDCAKSIRQEIETSG